MKFIFLFADKMLSHHHNQGSTCSDELSWSSPRRRPSCWGRGQWMWRRSNGGYRYCWTGGDSHAFGSLVGRTWKNGLSLKCLIVIVHVKHPVGVSLMDHNGNLPLHHPPPAPCRMRSEQRWRWYRSHLRSNGSTSSSLSADRPHQTSCRPRRSVYWHWCPFKLILFNSSVC